jgi:flagellar basal-body rod protein FlgB
VEIDDKTLRALATSLNLRQMRQDILSANIANSETPGYKAKRLEFEAALARALDVDGAQSMHTSSPEHYNVGGGGVESIEPEVYDDPNGIVSEDGNNVDREAEMSAMAENKVMYDASIQLLNKKLGLKKYLISNER